MHHSASEELGEYALDTKTVGSVVRSLLADPVGVVLGGSVVSPSLLTSAVAVVPSGGNWDVAPGSSVVVVVVVPDDPSSVRLCVVGELSLLPELVSMVVVVVGGWDADVSTVVGADVAEEEEEEEEEGASVGAIVVGRVGGGSVSGAGAYPTVGRSWASLAIALMMEMMSTFHALRTSN